MALVLSGDRSNLYDLQINCIPFSRFHNKDLSNSINVLSDEALEVENFLHQKHDQSHFVKVPPPSLCLRQISR